jgi:hypothetical protein
MRQAIKSIYQRLPFSEDLKKRLKAAMPYALQQPNPALRRFGTIEELYPWRLDQEIDTRLYVQNYFSVFYPQLDTSTSLHLWIFDEAGRPLADHVQSLGGMQTAEVRVSDLMAGKPQRRGTLMWHVALPTAVAERPECRVHHAYFTDRGYIAYVKSGEQVAFMHGIDRYAVFQQAETRFRLFYPQAKSHSWSPEIALGPSLGCSRLDIMTVNRSSKAATITLTARDAQKNPVHAATQTVAPRGLFCVSLDCDLLNTLGDAGGLAASGLPTRWTRLMILRHFTSGAISTMHC